MRTRLKELRLAKGLKQEEVAAMLNIGRTSYGAYELGDNTPPIDKLMLLADFYDVSLDYILYNEKTSPEIGEVVILYQGLSKDKREQIRNFIHFLKDSE